MLINKAFHGGASLWRRKPARWKLWLTGFVVVVVAAVDLTGAVRPSALSAATCTRVLFQQRPTVQKLLTLHRDTLIQQAGIHNLPSTLLAAIMVDHQRQQTRGRDFSDCLGSAVGANLSLGLTQMRIGTAAELNGRTFAELSASEFRILRKQLMEPDSNIAYAARELRALLNRSIRAPGISASALLDDPATIAILVSEFRAGRRPTANDRTRLGINAFSTLELMQNGTLPGFDYETDDAERVKAGIRGYLRYSYCESGIFNESVCADWLLQYPEVAAE